MAFIIENNRQVVLHATALDLAGNRVDNPGLIWGVSDDKIASIQPSADTLSATVSALGPTGTVTVTVISGGVNSTFEVQVVTGDVASILIEPDAPTVIPTAPPATP